MSGKGGGTGFGWDLLEGFGDLFELPLGFVLVIGVVALFAWVLWQLWALRPGRGTELPL